MLNTFSFSILVTLIVMLLYNPYEQDYNDTYDKIQSYNLTVKYVTELWKDNNLTKAYVNDSYHLNFIPIIGKEYHQYPTNSASNLYKRFAYTFKFYTNRLLESYVRKQSNISILEPLPITINYDELKHEFEKIKDLYPYYYDYYTSLIDSSQQHVLSICKQDVVHQSMHLNTHNKLLRFRESFLNILVLLLLLINPEWLW